MWCHHILAEYFQIGPGAKFKTNLKLGESEQRERVAVFEVESIRVNDEGSRKVGNHQVDRPVEGGHLTIPIVGSARCSR